MKFDHPLALALLGLAVPLVALHLYRGRLRRWPVPTLRFWDEGLREGERRTALRRLRRWASLAMVLGALVLLTLALAGPAVPGLTRPVRRWAVVLDNSPSMSAREPDGRTRLDHALKRAREFLRTRGSGDEAAVFDLEGLRLPWTRDLEAAARAIPALSVADPSSRRTGIRAAWASGADVTVVFFGDAPPGESPEEGGGDRLRFVRVGAPVENSGWIAGVLERRPGEWRMELVLEAAAFTEGPVRRTAVLSFEGNVLERRECELRPGETLKISWTLDPARYPGAGLVEGGRVRVAWDPPDGFPLDDEAYFVARPLTPPGVVVFHAGRPDGFLMKALESMRESGLVREVLHAPADRYTPLGDRTGEGWIFIFDRAVPPVLPQRGGVLVLGAPGLRVVERPAVTDWDREAPPNRLVDYGGLLLRKSGILRGAALLSTAEGPLAIGSSRGGRAVVETGFAFEDSEPRPALPMMLFNFIEWAAWEGLRSFRPCHRVGEPLRPVQPLWIQEGELGLEHDGRVRRVSVREGRPVEAPRAGPGFTLLQAGDRGEWTAANLFEAEESDLRARTGAEEATAPPPPVPWPGRIPWAPLAAAAALALLAVEWLFFQRGWA